MKLKEPYLVLILPGGGYMVSTEKVYKALLGLIPPKGFRYQNKKIAVKAAKAALKVLKEFSYYK